MPQYVDCYFLVNKRSAVLIKRFLDKFLFDRRESADAYPVPEFTEKPEVVFEDSDLLLQYLEKDKSQPYSIYWKGCGVNDIIKHAMFFFTEDGKLIIGVSVEGNSPECKNAISSYDQIKQFLDSEIEMGCIVVEEMPPTNSLEFRSFCKNRQSR